MEFPGGLRAPGLSLFFPSLAFPGERKRRSFLGVRVVGRHGGAARKVGGKRLHDGGRKGERRGGLRGGFPGGQHGGAAGKPEGHGGTAAQLGQVGGAERRAHEAVELVARAAGPAGKGGGRARKFGVLDRHAQVAARAGPPPQEGVGQHLAPGEAREGAKLDAGAEEEQDGLVVLRGERAGGLKDSLLFCGPGEWSFLRGSRM
jgi:hypothetical protein